MKYIFGNWKMYLDYQESVKLAETLSKEDFAGNGLKLAVFPSALACKDINEKLRGGRFVVGAQDIAWVPKGAYTGAVSAHMFKDIGCQYALVGHSERRHIFNETDDDVRKKLEACLDAGLIPVVCVGETKEELDAGKREYRLKKQLFKAFENLNLNGGEIIVAYEPVWAIGTGVPCLPTDADDVQGWIKQELKQYGGEEIPVLYGGSVNPENVLTYLELETVDGVLVGGASAKFDSWMAIVRMAEKI